MLRGAWNCSALPAGIPEGADLLICSDADKEDGNRQQQTCIAEPFAQKGKGLPGATIYARCAGITLTNCRLAAGTHRRECQSMRIALNRRNPSITEETGKSSRMAEIQNLRENEF